MQSLIRKPSRAESASALAVTAGLAISLLSAQPGIAQATDSSRDMLEGPALAKTLRHGGNVLFMRHAVTEADYADQDGQAEMGNCNTQRLLGEKGFNQAREIGYAIKWQNIPIGRVVASQYCRAFKTAALAFGHYTKNAALNFAKSNDDGEYSDAMKKKMKNDMAPLLSRKPREGTNTVLVGHDDPFEMATGIYPKPSGTVYVVQPKGQGGFRVIGRIAPDEWQTLSAPPNTHNDR